MGKRTFVMHPDDYKRMSWRQKLTLRWLLRRQDAHLRFNRWGRKGEGYMITDMTSAPIPYLGRGN